MKTFQITVIGLVSLLFFFACTPDEEPMTPTVEPCEVLLVGRSAFLSAERDPFQFKSATIDSTCLELVVNYAGGCGTANFDLIYIGSLNAGNPPTASMVLAFDDQDNCEAAIDTTLRFSLFGIQDSNYSKIALDIEGYSGGSNLIYEYE